jgi:APA family basic amino acid/polyamine antiporter
MAFAVLLIFRTRLNALIARGLVAVKLGVIAFILILGFFYIKPANWTPLMPFGGSSIIIAASLVFFAYLGFDVVAITAEESRRPDKDVPFGIIGSLTLCSIIYLLVALTLVGMVSYTRINPDAPFPAAFRQIGLPRAADLVGLGAIIGITSVLYMLLLAQPRVLFAMARDGLLPPAVAALHPRYHTPHRMTLLCGAAVALVSSLTPIDKLAFLCNIGTLFAFFLVCLGMLVLRFTHPALPRPFRCPYGKGVAASGALVCLGLMLSMPEGSWLRLFLWLILGLMVYFLYGWRSRRLTSAYTESRTNNNSL